MSTKKRPAAAPSNRIARAICMGMAALAFALAVLTVLAVLRGDGSVLSGVMMPVLFGTMVQGLLTFTFVMMRLVMPST